MLNGSGGLSLLAMVGYDAGMVWYVAMVGYGGGVNIMLCLASIRWGYIVIVLWWYGALCTLSFGPKSMLR